MTKRQSQARPKSPRRATRKRPREATVREIPMTNLGWTDEGPPRRRSGRRSHAAGTPGGGAAAGGLGGVNAGTGAPAEVDLSGALGSGRLDSVGESGGGPPYGGPSGGSVGGSPAEKRAKGGHLPRH